MAPKRAALPDPESDPDSSSDAESDAVPPSPTASDFTIKPIVSVAKPSPKKRRKTDEDDAKKGRLWGEDGEVAILQGMIDFRAKKGADPSSNMTEFYEFLRGSLKADVSRSQLSDKVKRLKKKYYNADGEVAAAFASGHEMQLAELAKRIWGRVEANGNGHVNGVVSSSGSKKKSRKREEVDDSVSPVLALPVSYLPAEKRASQKKEKKKKKTAAVVNYTNGDVNVNVNLFENGGDASDEEEEDKEDENEEGFWSRYPHLRDSLEPGKRGGMEAHFMLSLPLIGDSKAQVLDARWREVQLLEAELVAKKMALQQEHTNLIVNAQKSRRD